MKRFIFVFLLLLSANTYAETLDDMVKKGALNISVFTEVENPVVGQEVPVIIEIRTRYFFSGGTRIKLPEVQHMIVLQRSEFGVNRTERINGDTWVVQRWELSFFPQVQGEYTIPPIDVSMSIRGSGGVVLGNVKTASTKLIASVPDEMKGIPLWNAATSLTVKRTLTPDNVTAEPGETFEIKVVTAAEGLMAMMLPPYELPQQSGLGVYAKPPVQKDLSERGENRAIRTDLYSVVIEKGGEYVLPPKIYHWWNLKTGTSESITLSALKISGSGIEKIDLSPEEAAKLVVEQTKEIEQKSELPSQYVVMVVVAVVVLVGGLWYYLRTKNSDQERGVTEKEVLAKLEQFKKQKDITAYLHWAYYWVDHFGDEELNSLLRRLAKTQNIDEIDTLLEAYYTEGKAGVFPNTKALYRNVEHQTDKEKIEIKLNP